MQCLEATMNRIRRNRQLQFYLYLEVTSKRMGEEIPRDQITARIVGIRVV